MQIADPTFFMKMVPLMDDGDDVAMVLSPQCFHNVHHQADIFNHTNIHFWEYMQIGYDALSFISCTGASQADSAESPCLSRVQHEPYMSVWIRGRVLSTREDVTVLDVSALKESDANEGSYYSSQRQFERR